jgi:hypothetical protein
VLKIISASTIMKLEREAEDYDIQELGSLAISNGHYFLSFLGEPKVTPFVIPEETYVKPEVTKEEIPAIEKPKPTRRKRKPNTNL